MSKRYQKSEAFLKKVLELIPLGSQTFSKSKTQFPLGVSPYFIERGKGCYVWDIDGNKYIDFSNSLAAISLGYQDPDVDAAVKTQLKKGTLFSLPSPLEFAVAEQFKKMVPCAEMVRFGKNGSDATAGAVRVARAYTKRDHVAVCGYHGWQDWYIGSTTKDLGVPQAVKDLTHKFAYNNIPSLEKIFKEYPGQIAAVILEPMNVEFPKDKFLEKVKMLTHQNGAVLIFDEMITGFRYANGGAQEYFNVTPDLATFGKALANGYPLSAVAGKKEIMELMEEIFFSFTFGGETLSLAAALDTMKKLEKKSAIKKTITLGERLIKDFNQLIKKLQLEEIVSIVGHPTWTHLVFKDAGGYTQWHFKTFYLQEMFAAGILIIGSHNLSYAHTSKEIDSLLSVYEHFFNKLKKAIENKTLETLLLVKPLLPLFKVR